MLEKLNNKKIGTKHVAVRYAKSLDSYDDKKSQSNLKIPALAAGGSSKGSKDDKKSKIQLLEEQLKNLRESKNDFEINSRKDSSTTEPLIKKYQYNKDLPSTSSNRYSYVKKRRRPY